MQITKISSSSFMKKIDIFLTSKPNNLTIIFIALLMSLSVTLLNNSWMYNRLGELDHFAYLGAAVYFPNNLKVFPNHEIVELVPTYLPTALLYHLFTPEIANFIKDQIFLIASLFLFMHISLFLTNSILVTLSITIALIGSYSFLVSIGSDYTDSFIQLFFMAHLYLFTIFFEGKSRLVGQNTILLILGVTSALMFSSGVMSIVYIANLMILFYLLNIADEPGADIFRLLNYIAIWLIGATLTVGLISVYLYTITGDFYMRHNLHKLFSFVGGLGQFHPLLDWLPFASWLILPFAVVLYFLLSFFIRFNKTPARLLDRFPLQTLSVTKPYSIVFPQKLLCKGASKLLNASQIIDDRQQAFTIFMITTLGALIFIQLVIKQWSLQFMYFSQGNFIYFLGLAIIFNRIHQPKTVFKNMIFLSVITLISAFTLNLLNYRTIDFEMIVTNYFRSQPTILPWLALVISFLTLMFLYSSKKINRYFFIIPILIFHAFSYSEQNGGFCCINSWKVDYLKQGRSTSEKYFYANFKLSYFLDDLDKERVSDIWFDEKERLGLILRQVFSMNYFNVSANLINKIMPMLGDYSGPIGSSGHSPKSSKSILILSEDPKKIEIGLKNLNVELGRPIDYEIFAIKIGEIKLYAYKTSPLS